MARRKCNSFNKGPYVCFCIYIFWNERSMFFAYNHYRIIKNLQKL